MISRWAISVILVAAHAAAHAAPHIEWTDASDNLSGFTHQTTGSGGLSGVAWLDYDGDGHQDLFVANGSGYRNGLLRNDGQGHFTDEAVNAGLLSTLGVSGVVAADLDNDGDPDVVVAGQGEAGPHVSLFRNDEGFFTDVTPGSGLTIPAIDGQATHLSLADIDGDTLLDLLVVAPGSVQAQTQPGNLLFRNTGGLKFLDISAGSGAEQVPGSCASAFTDYNGDGLQDIVLANCNEITFAPTPISLLVNNGDLTFTDLTVFSGLDTHQHTPARGYWMCVGIGDPDNDLDFDIFATNMGPANVLAQTVGLFRRQANGTFSSAEGVAGLAADAVEFGWGCSFADFDNDGDEDLFFVGSWPSAGFIGRGSGNPGSLYANMGDGTFKRMRLPIDLSSRFSSGLGLADYDNDGWVDIAVGIGAWENETQATPVLLHNDGIRDFAMDSGSGEAPAPAMPRPLYHIPKGNSWLKVRLQGDGSLSNRDAIGARVRLSNDAHTLERELRAGSSFLSQDSLILHFGLGSWRGASQLLVRWPSGTFEVFEAPGVNRLLTFVEGQGERARP